jgi:hypothetical protein
MADTPTAAITPVEKPITGKEPLGDLLEPTQARGFNTRDLDLIDANFAPTDEVAIDNPVGGILRGREQPHLMYERIVRDSIRRECYLASIRPARVPPV